MTEHHPPPSLADMRDTARRLGDHIVRTPSVHWRHDLVSAYLGPKAEIFLKLELLQRTGTFKARGALNNVMAVTDPAPGVTAVSAGNHAIAVAYAARAVKSSAKVVMLASANAARRAAAEAFGAEIIIEKSGQEAFAKAEEIAANEGRTFIHPFEGRRVTEATGGVALEFFEDVGELDAIVVAIGGGGLCSGVSAATKQLFPKCAVYGVEPIGADVMGRSFAAGSPQYMDKIDTIADSLAPPMTTPYAYSMCRQFVDDIVTVSDDDMAVGALHLFNAAKLAVEPAAGAALAGALGPLRDRLMNKRFGIILCGANINSSSFCDLINRGEKAHKRGVLSVN